MSFFKLIPDNANFDFLGKAKIAGVLSFILAALSIYIWFDKGESKYGVDYLGGTEIVVKLSADEGSQGIREALQAAGIEGASVQSFEKESNEYSIKISGSEEAAKNAMLTALRSRFADKLSIERTDVVGPTIGEELRAKAMIAILFGLIGILIYVSVRFEFAFALGAVVALFHDVIISTGIYLYAGREINASTLAAILTIVGYSVNDTIIIFDRVREEILKSKNVKIIPLINQCINVTLPRTIITSLLTFFSALALLLYGGGAIADLSLYLVIGILIGSYSTIFIASPVVIAWDNWSRKREEAKKRS